MSFGWLVVKRMRSSPSMSGQIADQPGKTVRVTVVGVDVLAQKRDLAHAAFHQVAGLGHHPGGGAADFGATGIGHDAEGAELVTAFLHRQEGCRAACRLGASSQVVEFVLFGKVGVERLGALPRLRLQFGQSGDSFAARPPDRPSAAAR